MKRFVISAGVALLLLGSAQARDIAFCDSSFDIQKVSGDKAVCANQETAWVTVGPRKCSGDGVRVADEASDGGDKCKAPSGLFSAISGPAAECFITYGLGARLLLVSNGIDQCEKEQTRTIFGNIKTRNE